MVSFDESMGIKDQEAQCHKYVNQASNSLLCPKESSKQQEILAQQKAPVEKTQKFLSQKVGSSKQSQTSFQQHELSKLEKTQHQVNSSKQVEISLLKQGKLSKQPYQSENHQQEQGSSVQQQPVISDLQQKSDQLFAFPAFGFHRPYTVSLSSPYMIREPITISQEGTVITVPPYTAYAQSCTLKTRKAAENLITANPKQPKKRKATEKLTLPAAKKPRIINNIPVNRVYIPGNGTEFVGASTVPVTMTQATKSSSAAIPAVCRQSHVQRNSEGNRRPLGFLSTVSQPLVQATFTPHSMTQGIPRLTQDELDALEARFLKLPYVVP